MRGCGNHAAGTAGVQRGVRVVRTRVLCFVYACAGEGYAASCQLARAASAPPVVVPVGGRRAVGGVLGRAELSIACARLDAWLAALLIGGRWISQKEKADEEKKSVLTGKKKEESCHKKHTNVPGLMSWYHSF